MFRLILVVHFVPQVMTERFRTISASSWNGAHGSIDTGSERRKFDHEGIPGVSFLVFFFLKTNTIVHLPHYERTETDD